MPKIRALLTVEFESISSQPAIIDQTLDSLLQPACRIVSRTISIVDDDSLITLGSSGLQNDRRHCGDSYRPRYSSNRESATKSSQRPGANTGKFYASSPDPSSQRLDSDLSPVDLESLPPNSHSTRSLGTRYDALIDSTTSFRDITLPDSPSSGRARSLRSSSPYSPPPASHFGRDRSASPRSLSGGGNLRRSERLRDKGRGGGWPVDVSTRDRKEARESPSDRLTEWRKKQDRAFGRGEPLKAKGKDKVVPGSLEAMAKDPNFKLSGSNRFDRQVQRHGVLEALRLQNERTNSRIKGAKRRSAARRWEPDQVKESDRLDSIIDQIGSFDFSKPPVPRPTSTTMNSLEAWELLVAGIHPPVETRKKKGGGAISPYRGGLTPSAHVIYDEIDLALMPELNLNNTTQQGETSPSANHMQLETNNQPVDMDPSGQVSGPAAKTGVDAMEDVS